MPINLEITVPGKLVVIEDTSVTTASESRTVTAVNDYIYVNGANDIAFTVTDTDGNTQTITLSPGMICTTPFQFKSISWASSTGTSSFRMSALQIGRILGR